MTKINCNNNKKSSISRDKNALGYVEGKIEFDTRGMNAKRLHLAGFNFSHYDLMGANFSHSIALAVNFNHAILMGANLEKALMLGANFRNADLRGACLKNTNVSEADFSDADLRDCQCRGANMGLANLIFTNVAGADFTAVHNLTSMQLCYATNLKELIIERSDRWNYGIWQEALLLQNDIKQKIDGAIKEAGLNPDIS